MSNINVTPGTGAVVATETAGGADYQKIQLWGAGGSSIAGITPDGSIKVSVIGVLSAVQSGTVISSISGTVVASVQGTVVVSSTIGATTLYAQPASFVAGTTSIITGTASVLVLGAPASGIRNNVTHILVSNQAAVATVVNIVDNGQVIYAGVAAANGGGFSATLPVPLRQPTSTLALYAQTPTQASVLVSMSGYVA